MRLHSSSAHRIVALCVMALGFPRSAVAQYQQTEPMACPTELLSYYAIAAAPSGVRYTFVSDWQHASNPGSGVTQAFYDPVGSFLGYTPTLNSTDGRAEWHYAGIYVACKKIVWYRPDGSIENVVPVFSTVYTEGEVEEKCSGGGTYCSGCGSGGGGGSGTTPTYFTDTDYDPYDPAYMQDGPSGSGSCGGSTGGSGTQYSPGQSTGGETVDWNTGIGNGGSSACGPVAVVEYICIDEWDGTKWVTWSCGYATVC